VTEIEADGKEFFAVRSEVLEVGRGKRQVGSSLLEDG
jgi:hypothetical protein